jgi:rare lipoprotein A
VVHRLQWLHQASERDTLGRTEALYPHAQRRKCLVYFSSPQLRGCSRNELLPRVFTAHAIALSGRLMSRLIFIPILLAAALFSGFSLAQNDARSFSGLCTFYAGRGTGFTAAHRTLPFGTRLRVTDQASGRSVIVVINDRGPFGRGRVLDLSIAAARALGMIDRGVISVHADLL